MDNLILIKYGELTTKGDNIKVFINILYNYLKNKLGNIETNIIKERGRMYIEFNNYDLEAIKKVLANTFGILSYNLAYKVNTDEITIKAKIIELLKEVDFNTFKVITNRRDKNFAIKSMDFNCLVGGYVLKNIPNIKVNVHNPDIYINIEINKDNTYIYFNEIKGLGGYPVGVQGKSLLMLSGGIDSPVAGYLALKRGIKIDAIYFEALPHTSLRAREKVINLAKELLKYSPNFNLFVVPITELQEEIYKNINQDYMITILRRMMYRIAEQIAKKNNHVALINGESIGQVASQTLTSISVVNEVVKIPIIRPVACFDKLEIIDIAKKINTYDISILPFEDCCTVFVPRHPVINPKQDRCILMEQNINYETLINKAIDNTLMIKIDGNKVFDDLL